MQSQAFDSCLLGRLHRLPAWQRAAFPIHSLAAGQGPFSSYRHQSAGSCTFLGRLLVHCCLLRLVVKLLRSVWGEKCNISNAYHGPLPSFDPHLIVAAFFSVQGTHKSTNRCSSDHIYGDASFNQRSDNSHLGASPVPRKEKEKKDIIRQTAIERA